MRYLFLIMSTLRDPWLSLNENAKSTWLNHVDRNNSKYFYCFGREEFTKIDYLRDLAFSKGILFPCNEFSEQRMATFSSSDEIRVDLADRWGSMLAKFAEASKLLFDTLDFDFLVRLGPSTFVNINALEKCLDSGNDYCGANVKSKNFASGWGSIFSREAIKAIVQYDQRYARAYAKKYDDEAIGDMMRNLGFYFNPCPSAIFTPARQEENLQEAVFIRAKAVGQRLKTEMSYFKQLEQIIYS